MAINAMVVSNTLFFLQRLHGKANSVHLRNADRPLNYLRGCALLLLLGSRSSDTIDGLLCFTNASAILVTRSGSADPHGLVLISLVPTKHD